MAAYPALPMRSKVTPINDRRADLSDAGTVRIVDLAAAPAYRVQVTHALLSAAELATLLAFWQANAGEVVTVAAGDGNAYDCLFTNEPAREVINARYSSATVELIGTRNA